MKLQIYIGYDPREEDCYRVLHHSIERLSSKEVEVIPLRLTDLKGFFANPAVGATEFSFSRFLVPSLCNYKGWAVFMDCDMLCRVDIAELMTLIKGLPPKAVYVCKHDYMPTQDKAIGVQMNYPKKNWSSFMVFNNKKCRMLSLDYVNRASGKQLHQFEWVQEAKIGELPLVWNWLVGEYEHNDDAKILHYTLGAPCFEAYKNCDHSPEWHHEFELLNK